MNVKRLLYIDDEYNLYDIFKHILRNDCRVDYASNGAEGFLKYKQNKYDMIFTDYDMPVMNGKELIKKVRENDQNIPIILVTGNHEIKSINTVQIIYKPFSAVQIKELVF